MNVELDIVIVNYNVREFLHKCLDAIYRSQPRHSFRVYVVDNNSSDGSVSMVRDDFPNVEVIANEMNAGFAKASNQAMRQSTGKYILLLNPDAIVNSNTIDKMIDCMEQTPQAAALGCKILNPDGSLQNFGCSFPRPTLYCWDSAKKKILKKSKRQSYQWEHSIKEVEYACGACLMLRRSALNVCGLLDERFFLYAEEADLCYRLKQTGWKVYVTPDAEVIHFGGIATSQNLNKSTEIFLLSKYYFIKKHYSNPLAWFMHILGIIDNFFLLLYFSVIYFIKIGKNQSNISNIKYRWLFIKGGVKTIRQLLTSPAEVSFYKKEAS